MSVLQRERLDDRKILSSFFMSKKNNFTVVKNKEEKATEEEQIVSKLKPKLSKFLIDQQVNKASETAHQAHEKAVETLKEMDKTQADLQASKIAMHSFLDLKLWEKFPPPLEYAWLTGVRSSDGKRLSPTELKSEFADDISGFSTFLVTEYMNMKKEVLSGKYPNPMAYEEATIVFFWQKFCSDMTILIKSDARYQALGNKGLLLPN